MEAPLYRNLKIDLDALLPDVAGTIRELYDRGGQLDSDVYIAIIHLSLIKTHPFKTTDANVINVCSKKVNQRCCTDRPRLIQKLIRALLRYESRSDVKSAFDEYNQRYMGLHFMVKTVVEFKHLRDNDMLPSKGRNLPNNKTIDKALETMLMVDEEVTKAHNQPTPLSDRQAALLCDQNMRAAFKEHVPAITDQEMGLAIASIFLHFGIEKGTVSQIAERIRKRRERSASND